MAPPRIVRIPIPPAALAPAAFDPMNPHEQAYPRPRVEADWRHPDARLAPAAPRVLQCVLRSPRAAPGPDPGKQRPRRRGPQGPLRVSRLSAGALAAEHQRENAADTGRYGHRLPRILLDVFFRRRRGARCTFADSVFRIREGVRHRALGLVDGVLKSCLNAAVVAPRRSPGGAFHCGLLWWMCDG